jgi:hypothetical protein
VAQWAGSCYLHNVLTKGPVKYTINYFHKSMTAQPSIRRLLS